MLIIIKLRRVTERRHQQQPLYVPILPPLQQDVDINPTGEETKKETIEILDVSDCAWLIKMMILVFGFVLFLIEICLYNIPAALINNNIKYNISDTEMLKYPQTLWMNDSRSW